MLKENLVMLRSIHGFSQAEIAEKINISRQAYAKWETGATVPDVEKCSMIAELYGVTLDSLVNADPAEGSGAALLAPKGKNIWGSVIINERGQLVIPKGARDKLGFAGGTRLIVLSDDEGVALVSAKRFNEHIQEILKLAAKENGEDC